MPISNFQLPIAEKKPFAVNEIRPLTIRAEWIDPKYLIEGEPPSVEAEHRQTEKHPTHEARYFQLSITNCQLPISVQLNHGDPADDEARLAAIAEDLLTTEDAETAEISESPVPGAGSLVPNGGEA